MKNLLIKLKILLTTKTFPYLTTTKLEIHGRKLKTKLYQQLKISYHKKEKQLKALQSIQHYLVQTLHLIYQNLTRLIFLFGFGRIKTFMQSRKHLLVHLQEPI